MRSPSQQRSRQGMPLTKPTWPRLSEGSKVTADGTESVAAGLSGAMNGSSRTCRISVGKRTHGRQRQPLHSLGQAPGHERCLDYGIRLFEIVGAEPTQSGLKLHGHGGVSQVVGGGGARTRVQTRSRSFR